MHLRQLMLTTCIGFRCLLGKYGKWEWEIWENGKYGEIWENTGKMPANK